MQTARSCECECEVVCLCVFALWRTGSLFTVYPHRTKTTFLIRLCFCFTMHTFYGFSTSKKLYAHKEKIMKGKDAIKGLDCLISIKQVNFSLNVRWFALLWVKSYIFCISILRTSSCVGGSASPCNSLSEGCQQNFKQVSAFPITISPVK